MIKKLKFLLLPTACLLAPIALTSCSTATSIKKGIDTSNYNMLAGKLNEWVALYGQSVQYAVTLYSITNIVNESSSSDTINNVYLFPTFDIYNEESYKQINYLPNNSWNDVEYLNAVLSGYAINGYNQIEIRIYYPTLDETTNETVVEHDGFKYTFYWNS